MTCKQQRQHGKNYTVKVSLGKYGEKVGIFPVFARDPKHARKLAIEAAQNGNPEAENLHAHAPQRAA